MSSTRPLFQVFALVALLFALGTFARGQGTPGSQGRSGRPDAVQRELQRQFEMQMIEKALRAGPSRRVEQFAPLVLEEIRNDFLQIQIVDRKLMAVAAVPDNLDLEFVVRSAAEIRKRAKRLKRNLALPEPATAPLDRSPFAVEAGIDPLRSSLGALSHLIDEFVSNPMFEAARLVDMQLSAKARRDMEAIIELSGEIKRSSEKLKSTVKSR